MKNLKKVVAVVLTAAIAMTMGIAGTVAYLTQDVGTKTNTFQVGTLDVYLSETTDVIGGGEVVSDDEGADYSLLVPGDKIVKEVKLENKGNIDAYVKVVVTLKNKTNDFTNRMASAIDDHYEGLGYTEEEVQAKYDEIFDGWGINYTHNNEYGYDTRNTITKEDTVNDIWADHVLKVDYAETIANYWLYSKGNWFLGEYESNDAYWVDGHKAEGNFDKGYYTEDMGSYEARYTYYLDLPAGEDTVLFNGFNIPMEFNADQLAMFDGLTVDIKADAVQKANFENARSAFLSMAAGDGITVVDYYHKVATADELVEALEAGEDVVLTDDVKIDPANMSNAYGKTGINVKNGQTIDGNGNTLDIEGAGGTWDSGINTTGGLIKNITVTGSFRGIFINHNSTHSEPVVLENVTIDGTTYTISCDQGLNQNLVATNSTFKGWTSYAKTLGTATFTNCYFGEGNGYAFCRPYAPTTFVGCEFEAGYEMDPRAAVTFENCTIGGVALTADNLATLVTSNIANATVK